jgi:hypothetical protein
MEPVQKKRKVRPKVEPKKRKMTYIEFAHLNIPTVRKLPVRDRVREIARLYSLLT